MAENKAQQEENTLQKELFEVGKTDDELRNIIKQWLDESEDFYSHLKRIWEDNIKYYEGRQTGIESITGKQSKAVENRVFMAVETMIPICTARLPDIECVSEANDELSQINASDLQDILGYHMEQVGIQEKAEKFIRDMLVKRYGVFKVKWDSKKDDVGLSVIDPRRIRVPRYGSKFVIEELELSYDQLVEQFGKEKADIVFKSHPPTEVKNKARERNFPVLEVWGNDMVCWKAGSEILKKQKNPYYDFKNTENNFFDSPKPPYVVKSLFHIEESVIGDTDYIQQMISIQDNINKRKRQIENITEKVGNPVLAIDSDVMTEEEAENITNEPGFILYGKDAANEQKIRFHSPGQVPAYLFSDLDTSREAFDNIWGVHSTTRGEREGRETLGGRKLLRQADLGRIDLVARQIERAMNDIAEYWTQLIKLFYTDERSFSILGEDGIRFIKDFKSDKVGKIRLIVKPGSTLPKDEVTIHQEAITLWQMQAIGVKTLYKMLKLPNIPDAIEDFVQLKSGQLFAGGAPQGMQAPPVMPTGEGLAVNPQEMV